MKRLTRGDLAHALKAAIYVIDHPPDVTGLMTMARAALDRAYREGLVPWPETFEEEKNEPQEADAAQTGQ